MAIKVIVDATCACMAVVSLSAEAALFERLGGLAYYDDVADLTWLTDANAAGSTMNWADANAWAASLNVNGVEGWRLPVTIDVGLDGPSPNPPTVNYPFQGIDYGYNIITHSELSNMFYNVLGNLAYYDISGVETGCTLPNYCITNTGPFSNIQLVYWSATELAPYHDYAWAFHFGDGAQVVSPKDSNAYAWAVHSGDVSAVPVPAAIWLFGSGLLGLAGITRYKKAKLT